MCKAKEPQLSKVFLANKSMSTSIMLMKNCLGMVSLTVFHQFVMLLLQFDGLSVMLLLSSYIYFFFLFFFGYFHGMFLYVWPGCFKALSIEHPVPLEIIFFVLLWYCFKDHSLRFLIILLCLNICFAGILGRQAGEQEADT